MAKCDPPKYHEVELGGHKIRIVGRGVYSGKSFGPLSDTIIEHFKTQVLRQACGLPLRVHSGNTTYQFTGQRDDVRKL